MGHRYITEQALADLNCRLGELEFDSKDNVDELLYDVTQVAREQGRLVLLRYEYDLLPDEVVETWYDCALETLRTYDGTYSEDTVFTSFDDITEGDLPW